MIVKDDKYDCDVNGDNIQAMVADMTFGADLSPLWDLDSTDLASVRHGALHSPLLVVWWSAGLEQYSRLQCSCVLVDRSTSESLIQILLVSWWTNIVIRCAQASKASKSVSRNLVQKHNCYSKFLVHSEAIGIWITFFNRPENWWNDGISLSKIRGLAAFVDFNCLSTRRAVTLWHLKLQNVQLLTQKSSDIQSLRQDSLLTFHKKLINMRLYMTLGWALNRSQFPQQNQWFVSII